MEIKTIWEVLDKSNLFDMAVNEALRVGWTLVKREILPGERYNERNFGRRLLYAELVWEDEEERPGND